MKPVRHQVIMWGNDCMWLKGSFANNVSEVFVKLQQFSYRNMNLKTSSATGVYIQLSLGLLSCFGRFQSIVLFTLPLFATGEMPYPKHCLNTKPRNCVKNITSLWHFTWFRYDQITRANVRLLNTTHILWLRDLAISYDEALFYLWIEQVWSVYPYLHCSWVQITATNYQEYRNRKHN